MEVTTGSRRLLRRLRDVMAGSGTAQERLNEVVRIIAADMVAEVCSCYVMRAGEVLELFATEGLRPEAVHRTRLRVGEGLVGVIAATARPLALADAQTHPDFAYRPETGEEIYHSLMGVPILRGGRVLGVLVVQNRTQRNYTEDEIEALQTIAMVLAELVACGELVSPVELAPSDGIGLLPLRLDGVKLNAGLAIGVAVLHEPRVVIRQVVAEDPQAEQARLRAAVDAMQSAIDELLGAERRRRRRRASRHPRDLPHVRRRSRLAAAHHRGRAQRPDRRGGGAEGAGRHAGAHEPGERSLSARAPRRSRGPHQPPAAASRRPPFRPRPRRCRTSSSWSRATWARRSCSTTTVGGSRGCVLEEGSPTAHVAVVARALDIPVVGRVKDVLERVEAGDLIVVDADERRSSCGRARTSSRRWRRGWNCAWGTG